MPNAVRNNDCRMKNCLKNAGLSLPDTAVMSDRELLRLPNFGTCSLRWLRSLEPAKVPIPKITPEMIEAGASVLYRMEFAFASEEFWAEEVYRAMAALAPQCP